MPRGIIEKESMDGSRAEQLITKFQLPIYTYVWRMVRHEADAADLTQEIFTSVLARLGTLDPSRGIDAYVYRTATHRVYRHLRSQARRKRREQSFAMSRSEAPRSGTSPDPGHDAVQREQEALLDEHLRGLPSDAQSLLTLHYYNGLSPSAIAQVLDTPRSTIRDRLRHSLDLLKSSLRRSGHLALLPSVEAIMRATSPITMPGALAQSLQSLAATTPTAVTHLSLGALIVTHKLLATTIVVALIASVVGYGVATLQNRDADDLARAQQRIPAKLATVLEEKRALEMELEELDAELAKARAQLSARTEELEFARKQLMALGNGPASDSDATAELAEPGIDWEQLRNLVDKNIAILLKLGESGENSDGVLTPEEERAMMEVSMALAKAAATAKEQGPYPILEKDILSNLLTSTIGTALEMDNRQLAQLSDEAARLLDLHSAEAPRSPLEAYLQRERIFDDLENRFADLLTPDQRDRFQTVERFWERFAEGSFRRTRIGIDGAPLRDTILEELTKHYQPDPDQKETFSRLAGDYSSGVRDLLTQYGQAPTDRRELSPEEQARLEQAMIDLQLKYDRSILRFLTEEQWERLQRRVPLLMSFEPGGSRSTNHSVTDGF